MWFTVNFREGRSHRLDEFPHVMLTQDNWDDFGYKTTFNSVLHLSADEEVRLANLKILKIVASPVGSGDTRSGLGR
jgi:hypothetical protein